jgi:cob(I)alamin adenosyltransferase
MFCYILIERSERKTWPCPLGKRITVDKGFIHIYTGEGKGKTTSAVGLAVRAKSRGYRVLFVQFMKNISGGETELLKDLGIKVLQFEKVLSPHFHPKADKSSLREEALKALAKLKPMLKKYDIAVLDEFNYLLSARLLTAGETKEFVKGKPESLDLVLTGRGAPAWLLELAEHITEMKDIKHPASRGVKARKGIEY